MNKNILCLIVLVSAFVFSCKKYDEGPLISIASKETRVANVWKVTKAINLNGTDTTNAFYLHKWEFTNKFSVIFQINQQKYFGRWQFTQGKSNLEIVYDSLPTQTYLIKRLKEKEMILTNRANDVTINFAPVN